MESVSQERRLAPVILFVYNRPWHTTNTLNALAEDLLAHESELYIFCDGHKNDSDKEENEKIIKVRNIVHSRKWCKQNFIIEHEQNKGLAESIIGGVSSILKAHEKVIVLEDDVIVSSYFLSFMNKALDFYENYKSVYSISGYNMPNSRLNIPNDYPFDVYVCLRNFSWGWGTWKDRWKNVNWDNKTIQELLSYTEIKKAFQRGGDDLVPMLQNQLKGEIDSWSVRFSFAHFTNHSVSIVPCKSYCNNIGMDGSGTHCSMDLNPPLNDLSQAKCEPKFLEVLYEDKRIINSVYSVFYCRKRSIIKKIINRISRIFTGRNQFIIKGKIYC